MGTFAVGSEAIGILVWLLWALIGALCGMVAARMGAGRAVLWFDIIIGAVAAVIGAYLSVQFLGDTATQLFLLSLLAAAFSAGIVLWIASMMMIRFFRK